MIITYDDSSVDMEHYHVNDVSRSSEYKITLNLYHKSYRVRIKLLNSTFQWIEDYTVSVYFNTGCNGLNNLLTIKNCTFANNKLSSVQSTVIN